MSAPGRAILLTGSTGYLGGMLAAHLATDRNLRLVLPVREPHTPETVLKQIAAELAAQGVSDADWVDRIQVLKLPPLHELPALAPALRREGVREFIHCAGCVDYFNSASLNAGNIELTKAMVELARELRVARFAFVSTAFSSGYRDAAIPESLHPEADEDPTDYTRTKRQAENVIAASGIPYLIVRPSVVVGNSRTGRYCGKRYGIYQLWAACEKILCVDYIPEIYAIAPPNPLPLLHQDAFVAGFRAAFDSLPPNRVLHLVSRHERLPTVRDLWHAWLMECNRPRVIHYYNRLADVPMERISRRQQMWCELTSVNMDISSRPWRFNIDTLESLRSEGLPFTDATLETIAVCQDRFIRESSRVQQFLKRFAAERQATPQVIEHG